MELKKNPEIDSSKQSYAFGAVGVFVVISLILASFSFQSAYVVSENGNKEKEKNKIEEEAVADEPEDEPVENEPEPEPEQVDPQPQPTEDTTTIENVDKEIKNEIKKEIEEEEEEVEAPPAPIVDYPDVEAEFPGGAAAMKGYLGKHIKYPEISQEMGDQGRVFIEFVVEKDGSLSGVKVLKGVSKEIDKEAKRVVRGMPKWKPAEQKGEGVRARCRIPIKFSLQ